MREIKFRAWDKKTKEMICEALEIKNIGLGDGSVLVNAKTQEGNELIWLQYTGLKDKNGKEIYEGDILSYELKQGWEIFFEDGHYYMMCDGHSYLLEKVRAQISEIVGNIYENPELLKQISS